MQTIIIDPRKASQEAISSEIVFPFFDSNRPSVFSSTLVVVQEAMGCNAGGAFALKEEEMDFLAHCASRCFILVYGTCKHRKPIC